MGARKLMAVLAHPDDESLGFGGTLASYAAQGAEVVVLTATRGESGRYHGIRLGDPGHPGRQELAAIREQELRAAGAALGLADITLLDYRDGEVDRADPPEAIARIARHIRLRRPDVVVTFGPDGAYGHPDHIAISQLTTAAIVAAADASHWTLSAGEPGPHTVSKLYYLAWPATTWAAYQAAFKTLTFTVDGVERQAVPWPDWAITTTIDTTPVVSAVERAVACHASQTSTYRRLWELPAAEKRALFGRQFFYRAFSRVNCGHDAETDLFEGLHR